MKRILFYLLLSLFCFSAFSQAKVGLGNNGIIMGLDSVNIPGEKDTCTLWIKNMGTSLLTGYCYMNTSVDSGSGYIPFSAITGYTPTISLPPGDSVQHTMIIKYDVPPFKIGPDIIVIWPVMGGVITNDSGFVSTHITDQTAVLYISNDKKIVIYPNPVVDELKIKQENSPGNIVASVRIRDLSGRLIKELYNKDIIPVGEYEKGIYILDISFKDGSSGRYKVIKE